MSGFKFPPPPPPPPAPVEPDQQVGAYNQTGSRGRGRGRGRGSGHGHEQSGRRGENTASGGPQYGPPQQFSYGRARQPSDFRGQANVSEHSHGAGHFDSSRTTTNTGSTMLSYGTVPPGSYVNPNFVQPNMAFAGGTGWPSAQMGGQDPGRNTQTNLHVGAIPARLRPQERQGAQAYAGHKRKFHAVQGTGQESQPGSLTNSITPTFGGSIVPEKSHHQPDARRSTASRVQMPGKPHARSLGLTPKDVDPGYSSSDSDEDEDLADEEATLAKALGSQLMFHDANGEMRTLSSAADLLAWRKARRSNFPTKDNVGAKDAEKRRMGALRRRLLVDARDALQVVINDSQSSNTKFVRASNGTGLPKPTKLDSDQGSIHGQPKGSEDKLPKADVPSRQPLDDSSRPAESGQETNVTSSPAVKDAIKALDSESDDDAPKEITAKQRPKAETALNTCRYFAASGYCRDGSACRFKHELPSRFQEAKKHTTAAKARSDPYAPVLDAPDQEGKKSIHQRLLEREQEGEDQLALQVIKYLGSVNFFTVE